MKLPDPKQKMLPGRGIYFKTIPQSEINEILKEEHQAREKARHEAKITNKTCPLKKIVRGVD